MSVCLRSGCPLQWDFPLPSLALSWAAASAFAFASALARPARLIGRREERLAPAAAAAYLAPGSAEPLAAGRRLRVNLAGRSSSKSRRAPPLWAGGSARIDTMLARSSCEQPLRALALEPIEPAWHNMSPSLSLSPKAPAFAQRAASFGQKHSSADLMARALIADPQGRPDRAKGKSPPHFARPPRAGSESATT